MNEEELKQKTAQQIEEERINKKVKVWLSEKEVTELSNIIVQHPDVELFLKVKNGEQIIKARENLITEYVKAEERRERLPSEFVNAWNHPKIKKQNEKQKNEEFVKPQINPDELEDLNEPPAEIAGVDDDLLEDSK